MAALSHLVQSTINKTLDLIKKTTKSEPYLSNDVALSKSLEVSRTTVRTVVEYLTENGFLVREGSKKKVLRKPKKSDYFQLGDEAPSKEKHFERFFLNLIQTGQLQPGDKFSELDLAKKSGCITITVREFLIRFSQTKLIQKKPRAQWQMVEFDAGFANELIEFRKILEMSSIRSLLDRSNDDPVWLELEQLLEDHHKVLANINKRYNDFPELDARLHSLIQDCSGNRFIEQFFEIVSFICHYHYQWDKSDERERNESAAKEHIEIITNLLARDIGGSIMSLERHLESAHKTLLKSAHGLHYEG